MFLRRLIILSIVMIGNAKEWHGASLPWYLEARIERAIKVHFLFETPEVYRFEIDDKDLVYLINAKGERYDIHASKIYVIYQLNDIRTKMLYDKLFPDYFPAATTMSTVEELNDMVIRLALQLYEHKKCKTDQEKIYVYQRMMMRVVDPHFDIKFTRDNRDKLMHFVFKDHFVVELKDDAGNVYPTTATKLSLVNTLRKFKESIFAECEIHSTYKDISEFDSDSDLNVFALSIVLELIAHFKLEPDHQRLELYNFIMRNLIEGTVVHKDDIFRFLKTEARSIKDVKNG